MKTGAPFEAWLDFTSARDEGEGRLWVTIECPGHHVKLRSIDWSGVRNPFAIGFDVGRVWISRR